MGPRRCGWANGAPWPPLPPPQNSRVRALEIPSHKFFLPITLNLSLIYAATMAVSLSITACKCQKSRGYIDLIENDGVNMKVTIPYIPREVFVPIHEGLETHKFSVIVAHRRMGKSVALLNHMIKMACLNTREKPYPRYAIIQPQLKQAKLNMWDYIKTYTQGFPRRKISESELYVEFLGRRIYLFGADNPDSMRGGYLDGAILDEYADMDPDTWNTVVYPMLTDYNGWVVFSGTPKGLNHFYDVVQKAKSDENYFFALRNITNSGVFTPEQAEEIKANMPPSAFAQEYLCDFNASGSDTLISIDTVAKATGRRIGEPAYKGLPLIIGVDVARFGDDSTIISPRQGNVAYPQLKFQKLDNMQVVEKVANYINQHKVSMCFIDAGRGEGVIDRLHQLGYSNVIEVPFGAAASDAKKYENKRAEMWCDMAEWLKEGCIPDDADLRMDLSAPTYKYSKNGRIVLESKADIKDRLKRSPDGGDALALTFALPVFSQMRRRAPIDLNTKYDFFPMRR